MTNRLYYTDAYRTTFDATIVDASEDGLRVYLSETAFYPTSGGQPHDLGTLEEIVFDRNAIGGKCNFNNLLDVGAKYSRRNF